MKSPEKGGLTANGLVFRCALFVQQANVYLT